MYKNYKLFLLLKTIFPLYMTMFTVCMLIICIRLLYKKDVLVIIFETDLNDAHLVKYEETLKKLCYRYKILTDKKWKGFGGKIHNIHKYLLTLPQNQIVVISDARDVLAVNYKSKELYEYVYDKLDHNIIVSSEIGCCVNTFDYKPGELIKEGHYQNKQNKSFVSAEEWKSMFKQRAIQEQVSVSGYKNSIHLNAGLYIGKVKNITKVYRLMNIRETDDDQFFMSEIFNTYPNLIKLDYYRFIFSNSHVWDTNNKEKNIIADNGCFYIKQDRKIIDTITNTVPFFIHTPGKHFNCYDNVYDMLKA